MLFFGHNVSKRAAWAAGRRAGPFVS
jgi:hypothetical protein